MQYREGLLFRTRRRHLRSTAFSRLDYGREGSRPDGLPIRTRPRPHESIRAAWKTVRAPARSSAKGLSLYEARLSNCLSEQMPLRSGRVAGASERHS